LSQQFAKLDCTNEENLVGGSDDPDKPLVTCDRDGVSRYVLGPAEVLGRQVRTATAGIDQQGTGGWFVSLAFNKEGTKKFGEITQRVVSLTPPQNQVAIVLDGLVVSSPRIIDAILGGQAQITGNFTQQEASDLANVLKYGSLPLAFDRGEVQQVSPTLGSDQLRAWHSRRSSWSLAGNHLFILLLPSTWHRDSWFISLSGTLIVDGSNHSG